MQLMVVLGEQDYNLERTSSIPTFCYLEMRLQG